MNRIRVLVIDDAAFTRDLVKNGIRKHFPHFALEEATNGKQAQLRLMQERFDLVLCDWEMPEMAGDELLSWMRQEPKTKDIPFVMITSRGDREHVVKAIELGVSNYLTKPFTTEKLVNVVTRVLSKYTKLSPRQLRGVDGGPKLVSNSVNALGAKRADVGLSGAVPIAARIGKSEKGVQPSRKTIGQFRFGGQTVKCLIKELTHRDVTGTLRREEALPQILELAVFDFQSDGQLCSLNGYIDCIRAAEDTQDTDFLTVTIRFIDEDQDKQSRLERYMTVLA